MPAIRNHIKGLKEVFDKYATDSHLTKNLFKKMLETEIGDEAFKALVADIGIETIAEKADSDGDGLYSFRELCLCAAYLGANCGKKCDA